MKIKLKKEKYKHECFFGITSYTHEARIVSLVNKMFNVSLQITEDNEDEIIFMYEDDTKLIFLLKNMRKYRLLNQKLRGVNFVILVYSNEDVCDYYFEQLLKMKNEEEDIIFSGKLMPSHIDKRFRL